MSIDSIAGPSEILVLADETANAHYVAADLLSQAEHDEMASAILITTSAELAQNVEKEIEGYLKVLSRKEIIEKSLEILDISLLQKIWMKRLKQRMRLHLNTWKLSPKTPLR